MANASKSNIPPCPLPPNFITTGNVSRASKEHNTVELRNQWSERIRLGSKIINLSDEITKVDKDIRAIQAVISSWHFQEAFDTERTMVNDSLKALQDERASQQTLVDDAKAQLHSSKTWPIGTRSSVSSSVMHTYDKVLSALRDLDDVARRLEPKLMEAKSAREQQFSKLAVDSVPGRHGGERPSPPARDELTQSQIDGLLQTLSHIDAQLAIFDEDYSALEARVQSLSSAMEVVDKNLPSLHQRVAAMETTLKGYRLGLSKELEFDDQVTVQLRQDRAILALDQIQIDSLQSKIDAHHHIRNLVESLHVDDLSMKAWLERGIAVLDRHTLDIEEMVHEMYHDVHEHLFDKLKLVHQMLSKLVSE